MTLPQAIDYCSAAFAGGLAIATVFRAGRSISRWAFVAGSALLAVEMLLVGLCSDTSSENVVKWQTWRAIVVTLLPLPWLGFSATYARGPNRLLAGRKGAIVAACLVLPFAIALWFRNNLVVGAEIDSWGTQWGLRWTGVGTALWVFSLIASVGVVVNLERTFRASVGTTRWRIKYMLFGVGVIFVARIYTTSQGILFRGTESTIETINSSAVLLGGALALRSFFRSGLFDLEVYPSRSILQKSLTVFLAGAYLLIVGVLAKIVSLIGGDASFPAKSFFIMVMVVSLAVVIQSDRVRLGVRRFVSRNFRRSPHDYRAIWKTFTEGTASRVEQADLCRGLVRLIANACDALSVSIFLLDDKKKSLLLEASTTQSPAVNGTALSQAYEASFIFNRFNTDTAPIDIETLEDEWALLLKKLHPTQFEKGGNRVCVPLAGRGEVLGVIVIGDRVGGVPFSLEDMEMLKCVGDHAAGSLLSVQLAAKLLQAKELEAFQAMAAFFVHDLKNAASTLNLMLQNFPAHFDNPEFKEDALRGISKTAEHINRLVGRLGMIRHELKIEPADADINELISSVLLGIDKNSRYTVTKDLQTIPKLRIDRDQIQKVFTNLILNATEAVSVQGEVRIATEIEGEWAVVTVADTGCGMTPTFLAHSLFRPFQTTKKSGLGIGMFQSKMIVEAHRGRITVASELGKGTTFRVFLPAIS